MCQKKNIFLSTICFSAVYLVLNLNIVVLVYFSLFSGELTENQVDLANQGSVAFPKPGRT